jgi:hypothetical protein
MIVAHLTLHIMICTHLDELHSNFCESLSSSEMQERDSSYTVGSLLQRKYDYQCFPQFRLFNPPC